jgi:hypothetical protein
LRKSCIQETGWQPIGSWAQRGSKAAGARFTVITAAREKKRSTIPLRAGEGLPRGG